ncbi:hypothetical protein POM88_038685 [Heracleum sosnowskyi]|uniref:Retrotransposon gag domain-containing protein n=1 Tax=Heracleum sosnowskyi TaxID=360622 RepID=A0AAD8M834_9APIA|nr:hypothetical protein POM88_038685 [Heracleum sosnowskyi]
MTIDNTDGRPTGFTEIPRQGASASTPPINRVLDFDAEIEEGPMPTPEEQKAMLLKWREETTSKSGKQKEQERDEMEARAKAKKREDDLAKLEAIKRRKVELDAEENALQDVVEVGERTLVVSGQRKEKKVHNDEDESSDSESHPRRTRSKITICSDTDDERDPRMKDRLSRMEKAMFGDHRVSHEPVVSEEIEQYRPPPGRQFPKMNEFNGKGDPEDHCEKSMKPRSICSYDQLKMKFLRHYSHLCQREKDTKALIHCRQRPDEELGNYLAMFKEEAGMLTNLDKVKAPGFLSTGLDPVKGKKL